MNKLQVLKLSGSPYEMGFQHGKKCYDAIHQFTEDRIRLCSDAAWTGFSLPRGEILELAEACVAEHKAYAPALMEELRGMADATGLGLAELIIMNGFTDFIDLVYAHGKQTQEPVVARAIDNCTAFLIPEGRTAGGGAFFGQTWDMHASATPFVILIEGEPENGPRFLTFTTKGCVGMIGMNEAGIAVGINNIMAADGQVGVTWNFIIRQVLAQDNLEDAVKCVTDVPRAGAHNYLLLDRNGRGCNIEGMGQRYHLDKLEAEPLIHTNHCVISRMIEAERERPPASKAHSIHRYERAGELLNRDEISVEDLMEVTRDEEAICVTSAPPLHVETSGAAIMRPATGDFWATWGKPTENEYEHFQV